MTKIKKLRRNIIINISATVILAIILGCVIFYLINRENSIKSEIQKIKVNTVGVRIRTGELESKISDTKKYKEIWKIVAENKKSDRGIKMDEVNNVLNSLTEKYNIYNSSIQVPLPEVLNSGIFSRKSLNVLHSTSTMSFDTISDVRANAFMAELMDKLPGYIIINSITIKKIKTYSSSDLVSISSGITNPSVSVKIVFDWYVYNKKEDPK